MPLIAGVLMATIFGLSFLFTKRALVYLTPLELLGFRFMLAGAALVPVALFGRVKNELQGGRWRRLIPLALIQPVLYFLFETAGLKLAGSAEAGMIIGSIPVIAAALAAIFLHERPGGLQVFLSCCQQWEWESWYWAEAHPAAGSRSARSCWRRQP